MNYAKTLLFIVMSLTAYSFLFLSRNTAKDISVISFPPMFDSNGELRRSTIRYGKFRKGGFDGVFRQALTEFPGYELSKPNRNESD